jgi:protein required for attachment to host cells
MKDRVWALVMNSTQARIMQGIAKGENGGAPDLILLAEHRKLRDIMSDKPGRSFSSVGRGRAAMEYASDPVKDAKRAFAEQAITLLHQHFVKHDFTHLAIFAGPDMLGLLRDGLPADLKHAVIIDMPKNLLHETPQELRRIVTEHVFTKG